MIYFSGLRYPLTSDLASFYFVYSVRDICIAWLVRLVSWAQNAPKYNMSNILECVTTHRA